MPFIDFSSSHPYKHVRSHLQRPITYHIIWWRWLPLLPQPNHLITHDKGGFHRIPSSMFHVMNGIACHGTFTTHLRKSVQAMLLTACLSSLLVNPHAYLLPNGRHICLPTIQWLMFIWPYFRPIPLDTSHQAVPIVHLFHSIANHALLTRSSTRYVVCHLWLICAPKGQRRSTTSTLCSYSIKTAFSKEGWMIRKR